MERQIQELLNYVNDKCDDYELYLKQPWLYKRHDIYSGKLEAYKDIKSQIEEMSLPQTKTFGNASAPLQALKKAFSKK